MAMLPLLDLYKNSLQGLGEFAEAFALKEEVSQAAILLKMGNADISLFLMTHRSRSLAIWLMQPSTNLEKERLKKAISLIDSCPGFSILDEGFSPAYFTSARSTLALLLENEKALLDFNRLSLPLASKFAEDLVAATLGHEGKIGEKEIKAAVLSALFNPLRQSVGSCFATAPGILIQKEQVLTLLSDLTHLLTMGKMTRVGQEGEYKVPFAISFGGEFLLKMVPPHGRLFLQEFPPIAHAFNKIDPSIDVASLIKKAMKKQEWMTFKELIELLAFCYFGLDPEEIKPSAALKKEKHSPLRREGHKNAEISRKIERCTELKRHMETLLGSYFSNPLLKAWEFTLASLADYSVGAFKGNMVVALGFDPEKKGGIGQLIYRYLEEKLKMSNHKLLEMQQEYERARQHLESIQALMASSQDVERIRRLKVEGESSLYHLRTCEELMDESRVESTEYSKFFQFLLEQYELLFSLYFQEVYDPELQEIKADLFEDSPAGFRLVYKYGRNEPKLWDPILDAPSYIESLKDFFRSTELSLLHSCSWEKGKEEIGLIIGDILRYIETNEFIDSAFARVRSFGFSAAKKTPWSYISGGTLETLVSCYFELNKKMSGEEFTVQNPLDLSVKIIDLLKDLPTQKGEKSLLLMQSPTHAFLIDRDLPSLKKAIHDSGFTYTWVRDEIIARGKGFYASQFLGEKEQEYLLERILRTLSFPLPHASFRGQEGSSLADVQTLFLRFFKNLKLPESALKSLIQAEMVKSLPFLSNETCFALMHENYEMFDMSAAASFDAFPLFSFSEAIEVLKWCAFKKNKMQWKVDYTKEIKDLLFNKGFSPPPMLYFADSNWSIYHFAFCVNPVSLELEFWRASPNLKEASPMPSWLPFFGNAEKKWKIFHKKSEYKERHAPSLDKLKHMPYKV